MSASYGGYRSKVIKNIFFIQNTILVGLSIVSNYFLFFPGKAITGISDEDWSMYVTEYLGLDTAYDGVDPKNMPWRYKHRRGEYEPSKYHIRLNHMRSFYKEEIPNDANELRVDRWTRAFCMDLFGSIMFPDKTGDSVAAMYLQFIRRLDRPANLNWGNAVLAYLYRQLSEGCLKSVASISGPLLLLQMWSWTRFPIGMPNTYRIY